jgi:hypothetical protein
MGMKRTLQRWELAGIAFIVVFGSSLHFLFELSGYWRPVAIIAAVNESTWEHFKMVFWPGLIWALIEFPFIRNQTRNFGIAKVVGLAAMPITIALLFYGYTAITGQHYLIADGIIFILAIVVGQWISLRLLIRPAIEVPWLRWSAFGVLAILIIAFSTLSYYPPKNFLFVDSQTGEYGILADYDHDDH